MFWLEDEDDEKSRNDQDEQKYNLSIPGLLLVFLSLVNKTKKNIVACFSHPAEYVNTLRFPVAKHARVLRMYLIQLIYCILKMHRGLFHIEVDTIQERALINDHSLKVLENVCQLEY